LVRKKRKEKKKVINNKFKENTKVALITLPHVIQKTNIIIALVIKKKKKKDVTKFARFLRSRSAEMGWWGTKRRYVVE
jgi:hypothetical protein